MTWSRQGLSANDRQARQTVDRRLWQMIAVMLLALMALLLRFGQLQLGDHDAYAARAETNRVKLRAIAPNRGLIVDRQNRILAENQPGYRLIMVPERVADIDRALDDVLARPATDRFLRDFYAEDAELMRVARSEAAHARGPRTAAPARAG